uniref:methyltransferase-like protein 7B isoform X2 n=1 Tax=Erigeron canadensis TaxID=72917 RepID=UPI001CB998B2|nr:methyltransferase-like protein 7B isoform X2 [Erigeron canadensis]
MVVYGVSCLPSSNQSNPSFHNDGFFNMINLKLNICPPNNFTSTSIQNNVKSPSSSSCTSNSNMRKACCSSLLCGRRPFLATISTTTALNLIQPHPSNALDSMDVLNRIHPPRPDWYEEFYAAAMDRTMKSYEAEIAGYKSQLFANLTGKAAKVLELGIGTGPNLKYYSNASSGLSVIGVDPNRKMEKYAQAAAEASGLPQTSFKFIHAVAEALPVSDASMDAVVGTLVLCSVKDVHQTLQEIKRVLKPGGLYIFVEHVAAKGEQVSSETYLDG